MEDDAENMDMHVHVGVGRHICTGTLMYHGQSLKCCFSGIDHLSEEAVGKHCFPLAWNSLSK